MNTWRLLSLETHSGAENMAIDEAILNARVAKLVPNTLRLYRWDPTTVSIGRNQSLSDEIDVLAAEAAGVHVVRRISGGGAVLHDRDREITYSVVVSEADFRSQFGNLGNLEVFHKIMEGITRALSLLALQPDQGVIHCPALFIDGKKISGNAQARRKGVILQHGTLLLDVDADFMYSILKAPRGVPKTRMVRSVYAKVAGIREFVRNADVKVLKQCLEKGFAEALGVVFQDGSLTLWEESEISRLLDERYRNSAWTARWI